MRNSRIEGLEMPVTFEEWKKGAEKGHVKNCKYGWGNPEISVSEDLRWEY